MKKDKKKGSPWISLVIIIFAIAASSVMEDSDEFAAILALIIFGAVLVFIISSLIKAAKKNTGNIDNISGKKNTNMHSHDRLTTSPSTLMECNGLEHYKKQLDGFLSAGIIDRNEYNVLLQKYRSQLGK